VPARAPHRHRVAGISESRFRDHASSTPRACGI
jgi:hypothetical protein